MEVIAESPSTGKRLLLDDHGYVFEGQRRKSLVIEQLLPVDDSLQKTEWQQVAEFSLTRERAEAISRAITAGWEPQ